MTKRSQRFQTAIAAANTSRLAGHRVIAAAAGHHSHGLGDHLTGSGDHTIARSGAVKNRYDVKIAHGQRDRNAGHGNDVHALVPTRGQPPDASAPGPMDFESLNPTKSGTHAAPAVKGHRSRVAEVAHQEPGVNAAKGHDDVGARDLAARVFANSVMAVRPKAPLKLKALGANYRGPARP
jgi:hypothetical protein